MKVCIHMKTYTPLFLYYWENCKYTHQTWRICRFTHTHINFWLILHPPFFSHSGQSWQSVGPADLPGPDPTGISCSRSVSVPGRSFWSWIRSGSVWGSSAVGRIGLLFRKYRHKVGRELKSGQFPDEAGIWQRICRAAQFPSHLEVHHIGLKLTKKSYTRSTSAIEE